MKAFFSAAILVAALAATVTLAAQQPKQTAKTPAPNAAASQKKSVTKTPYRTWAAKRYRSRARYWGPTVARKPVYAYQMQPTVDRYVEIQTALTTKGYFSGEVNGAWGVDSVEALKRFQLDQNIPPGDGRMNSLSLIALGLGPKRGESQTAASDAATPPAAVTTPNDEKPVAEVRQ